MMGELPQQQNALFYEFCLETHIPDNHVLRNIDQFLDFGQIRKHLQPFYSHTGRPSIDPELMIRMLLIGYCYGIRSERRLCEEVNYNLAYRWFCRLGLEDDIPNHSTFSKSRTGRFREADLLRFVFDSVVVQCTKRGLVKGEGFAIDASLVRADVSRQRKEDSPVNWTPSKQQSRTVKEYLDALDEEPALRREQKKVSLTDPMAQWSGAKGPAQFYYSTNYLIDVDHGVILDVEASPSTLRLEVATTKTMIERVEDKLELVPERLMGDTAYGTAENLGYLVEEKQIGPHIPVWDKTQRKDNTFEVRDFQWDGEAEHYVCPGNKALKRNRRQFKKPRLGVTKANTLIFRASETDCKDCPIKQSCCPNMSHRKIHRSIHEDARDVAKTLCKTNEYINKSVKERKKVEMLFAHMKRHLRFDRLRLRGLNGVNDEFLMVATVQNLRRMARLIGQPPPRCQLSTT